MTSRMTSVLLAAAALIVVSSISSSLPLAAQGTKPASPAKVGLVPPPVTDADKIKSAMSAAPGSIATAATIMDMASMKVIRAGTNGWTCFPDGPSPGVDPMCLDQNGMEWAAAWMSHKDPPKDKMAIAYMLAGGSDASNTDPFATEPAKDGRWVDTGPHLMVLNIGDKFAGYPTTAANTKLPYVMFPNTPYAHLMVPVK